MENRIVIEDDLVCAFPTNAPVVEGHMLIVPKRHVGTYEMLTAKERESIEQARMQLHTALEKAFGAEGFNYAWNENEVAGQSVLHFHLHMLPRKDGDSGVHAYDPRQFLYAAKPKHEREIHKPEMLAEVAKHIQSNL